MARLSGRFTWPFTATPLQVTTYLTAVALFSIAFLVFLNASLSLLIRDLLNVHTGWGDAVGTLGFADELLALVACPIWGLLSDRLGTRIVATVGYAIIGLSLFIFVQARNVYPDLLLARLLFSLGGAAATTMVTAILPSLTAERSVPTLVVTEEDQDDAVDDETLPRRHQTTDSTSTAETAATVTPHTYHPSSHPAPDPTRSISQIAGVVGTFTGTGALLALGLFLPLPAWLQRAGQSEPQALKSSFYLVGATALLVALACSLGLRHLPGEEAKSLANLLPRRSPALRPPTPYARLATHALRLAATDPDLLLACVGGFVARASSVAISTFVPLFVNAYFVSSGRCPPHADPTQIKEQCRRAYTLAAALTGAAELVALLAAPAFGFAGARPALARANAPLLVAAAAGIAGYLCLARTTQPDPREGGAGVFATMALVGVGQIGAIVCSLSVLGRGIARREGRPGAGEEAAPLLAGGDEEGKAARAQLKGTLAGLYSLAGGAGILLLTKLGGGLFDRAAPGAPFYLMAGFNAVLMVLTLGATVAGRRKGRG